MRRILFAFALAIGSFASASDLKFTLYPPTHPEAGRKLTMTVLIENTGQKAAPYNIYTCPATKVTSDWTKKVVQEINGCIEPLTNITIPAGGRHIFTFELPKTLPSEPYQAVTTLNDVPNGHKATLKTSFTVWDAPQVVQQVVMPPVVLAGKPLTVQIATTNLSGKVFSQDLRLCYTTFIIRDRLGRVVYQTPAEQACTADIRPTTLKTGERPLEGWRIETKLPAGKYQLQHLSSYGTPLTTFEVK